MASQDDVPYCPIGDAEFMPALPSPDPAWLRLSQEQRLALITQRERYLCVACNWPVELCRGACRE